MNLLFNILIFFLLKHSTISTEWYQSDASTWIKQEGDGDICEESHEEMQLRQWSHCLDNIENYERSLIKNNKPLNRFDTIVKLRPDDIWYRIIRVDYKIYINFKTYECSYISA